MPGAHCTTHESGFLWRDELRRVPLFPSSAPWRFKGPIRIIRVDSPPFVVTRQNRTKQNDFRNLENWTVAPEALTTTPLRVVRFCAFRLPSEFEIRHSSFQRFVL